MMLLFQYLCSLSNDFVSDLMQYGESVNLLRQRRISVSIKWIERGMRNRKSQTALGIVLYYGMNQS
jgi:hypothetical protein